MSLTAAYIYYTIGGRKRQQLLGFQCMDGFQTRSDSLRPLTKMTAVNGLIDWLPLRAEHSGEYLCNRVGVLLLLERVISLYFEGVKHPRMTHVEDKQNTSHAIVGLLGHVRGFVGNNLVVHSHQFLLA